MNSTEKIWWAVAAALFVFNVVLCASLYLKLKKLKELREVDSMRVLMLGQELQGHPVRNGSREEFAQATDDAAKPVDDAVKSGNVYKLRDAVIDAAKGALANFFANASEWEDPKVIRPPQFQVFHNEIMIKAQDGGTWTLAEGQLFDIHKDKGAGRCVAENGNRSERGGLFSMHEVGALYSIGFSVCVVGTNGVRRELSEDDAFNIGGKLHWRTGLTGQAPSLWSPIGDRMLASPPQSEGVLPELSMPLLGMPIVWRPGFKMDFEIKVLTGFAAKSIKPGEWLAVKVRRGCVVFERKC